MNVTTATPAAEPSSNPTIEIENIETVHMNPVDGMTAVIKSFITLQLAGNGIYGPIFYQLGNKIPLNSNLMSSLATLIKTLWQINNPDITLQNSDLDKIISSLIAGVQQL